mmetsp:Transcript_19671/g.41128  ORF Transcript_19671/g.41128 Transcript_19671/m.41128 type:complete len:511 (+) Transcript_19671:4419-5951(+)
MLPVTCDVPQSRRSLPLNINISDLDKSDERLQAALGNYTVMVGKVWRDSPEAQTAVQLTFVVEGAGDTEQGPKSVFIQKDSVSCRCSEQVGNSPASLSVNRKMPTPHEEGQIMHRVSLLNKRTMRQRILGDIGEGSEGKPGNLGVRALAEVKQRIHHLALHDHHLIFGAQCESAYARSNLSVGLELFDSACIGKWLKRPFTDNREPVLLLQRKPSESRDSLSPRGHIRIIHQPHQGRDTVRLVLSHLEDVRRVHAELVQGKASIESSLQIVAVKRRAQRGQDVPHHERLVIILVRTQVTQCKICVPPALKVVANLLVGHEVRITLVIHGPASIGLEGNEFPMSSASDFYQDIPGLGLHKLRVVLLLCCEIEEPQNSKPAGNSILDHAGIHQTCRDVGIGEHFVRCVVSRQVCQASRDLPRKADVWKLEERNEETRAPLSQKLLMRILVFCEVSNRPDRLATANDVPALSEHDNVSQNAAIRHVHLVELIQTESAKSGGRLPPANNVVLAL